MLRLGKCRLQPANITEGSSAGFTLIGVLISAGILSIMALLALKFFDHQMAAKQHIRTMGAVQSMEGGIASEILNRLNNALNANVNGCINLKSQFSNVLLEGGARYTFTTNIQLPANAPDYMKQAQMRCRSPRQPANINNSQDNQIYFCLLFQGDNKSTREGFLASKLAFAEVYFELMDLQTGQRQSCREYVNNRNNDRVNFHGGSALLSYYWQQESLNQQNLFAKSRYLTFVTPD